MSPDGPVEHFYTNQTHPYFRAPQLYLSLPARFVPKRQVISTEEAEAIGVNPKYFKDTSDAILVTSRPDRPRQFVRTFMSSFVRPGIGPENWVSRANYPALNVIRTGKNEMSIFMTQNYAQPTAHLRRYSLRLDGFSSLRAEYDGGEILTKPLLFAGNRLLLNFATSAAGGIRIELQEADGSVIPGFSLAECREVIGNEIEREVKWESPAKLNDLAGRPVRLRIVMKDADLYALQFRGELTRSISRNSSNRVWVCFDLRWRDSTNSQFSRSVVFTDFTFDSCESILGSATHWPDGRFCLFQELRQCFLGGRSHLAKESYGLNPP